MKLQTFGVLLLLALGHYAHATDGLALTVNVRTGAAPEEAKQIQRGKMVTHQVVNAKVVSSDTVLDYMALKPSLDINGERIGFFREDVKVVNGVVSGEDLNCHISVVNVDGTGLEDLVAVDCPGRYANLDWPIGEWIYYEKCDESLNQNYRGSGEIWRVNAQTKAHEFVVDYCSAANYSDQKMLRWNLSADAKWAAVQLRGSGWGSVDQTGIRGHAFPPPDGNTWVDAGNVSVGCNLTISSTGLYMAGYKGSGHDVLWIYEWPDHTPSEKLSHIEVGTQPNGGITREDQASCAGIASVDSVGGGANFIKWACNSDKWCIEQATVYGGVNFSYGTYALYTNWVDKEAFVPPQILTPQRDGGGRIPGEIYYQNCAGDFWVKPPEGLRGAVETISGEWIWGNASDTRIPLRGSHSAAEVRAKHLRIDHSQPTGIIVTSQGTRGIRTYDIRGRAMTRRKNH